MTIINPADAGATERILNNTREDGDCTIWLGQSMKRGHPSMRHDGKTQLVRRVLWANIHGPIKSGLLVRMTCTTPLCINPGHMTLVTRKALAKTLGALGLMGGLVRSAAVARAKRAASGRLSDAQVREIRTSSEAGLHIAKRLGVAQSYVSAIRLHKARRDYSSPWSQLL